ncbi:hypothetical protein [[Clostridium] colinum]|uniref:hypothetical protein n=1 Tax=[Clostridium] colinum TaxID=36835 RepID=UPI00202573EF|nr:hypothetical protein [[Clostridium] colinum]
MNEKKKVILISGNKSNWYDQVIFIVKENKQENIPKNLVLEAEKIINEYISKKYNKTNTQIYDKINTIPDKKTITKNISKNKPNNKSIKFYNNILNVSIFFTIAFICYLIYQIYI